MDLPTIKQRSLAVSPLEGKSAGLMFPGQCCHRQPSVLTNFINSILHILSVHMLAFDPLEDSHGISPAIDLTDFFQLHDN